MHRGTAVAPLALDAGDTCVGLVWQGQRTGRGGKTGKEEAAQAVSPCPRSAASPLCTPGSNSHPAWLLRHITESLLHTPTLPGGESTCTNTQFPESLGQKGSLWWSLAVGTVWQ